LKKTRNQGRDNRTKGEKEGGRDSNKGTIQVDL